MRYLIRLKLVIDQSIVKQNTPLELLNCLLLITVPQQFVLSYDLQTEEISSFKIKDLLGEIYK